MSELVLNVPTPAAYAFLYNPPLGAVRYRIAWGGRGAGRSWNFGRALLVHGTERPLRILCAREWQNSIKDSVHRVLSDQIAALGLTGVYRIQEQGIFGTNGTEFLFKGLRRDIGAIKSTEGIDICWVEEGQSVSDHSWRELTPTIRAPGSEIWVTFNTGDEDDATYKRLVKPTGGKDSHDRLVRRTSFKDNPWLPDVLKAEEQESLRTDPEEHAHIWKGEFWRRSKTQVLAGKWKVADFVPGENWGHPYYGADFGFANDPAVIVKVWVRDNCLYVEHEAGGLELGEPELAEAYDTIPDVRDYTVRADAARPDTISAMCKRGFTMVAAPKGEGSVKDGISHLRSYDQIIIHPRCTRAINEARLWRYKTRPGASGDPHAPDAEVLPVLVPGNDNIWDAVRYALAELIRAPKRAQFASA